MMDPNYNREFDDVYFSIHHGLSESQHVFIQGNDLVSRCRRAQGLGNHLTIGELGFGSGLNVLALAKALVEDDAKDGSIMHRGPRYRVDWYSVDIRWMELTQRAEILWVFPELASLVDQFLAMVPHQHPGHGAFRVSGSLGPLDLTLTMMVGDVLQIATILPKPVDAWILDGHSPDKNPAMWSPGVFELVARHSKAHDTTLATYTAKGVVKQGLREWGFDIQRTKGHGVKRHMIRGVYRGKGMLPSPPAS